MNDLDPTSLVLGILLGSFGTIVLAGLLVVIKEVMRGDDW